MQIFAKTITGNTVILEVEGGSTIAEIKKKIENVTKIASAEQRLLYAGKQLDDKKTVKEFGIVEDSTIHVVLNLTKRQMNPNGNVCVLL